MTGLIAPAGGWTAEVEQSLDPFPPRRDNKTYKPETIFTG